MGTGTDSKGVVKTFKANSTGGEYKHTLSVNEMPSHKHLIYQYAYNNDSKKYAIVTGYGDNAVAPAAQISIIQNSLNNSALGPDSGDSTKGLVNADYTGGSKAHNIVQPYITTYMYKRVK